jgi:hypothetical protein
MIVAVVMMLLTPIMILLATVTALVAMFVAMFVTALVVALDVIAMMLAIVRDISIVIPIIPDKVDRLPARIIGVAVPSPIPFMPRPYVKIDWGRQLAAGASYSDDWRRVNKLWPRSIT